MHFAAKKVFDIKLCIVSFSKVSIAKPHLDQYLVAIAGVSECFRWQVREPKVGVGT